MESYYYNYTLYKWIEVIFSFIENRQIAIFYPVMSENKSTQVFM